MCAARSLRHEALFYGTDEGFDDVAAPFLREGLERGEAVVALTSHNDRLRRVLADSADEIRFVDGSVWPSCRAATVGLEDILLAIRSTPSRVVAEPRCDASSDGWATWIRFESALNLAFADAPALIMCPYDTRVLPASVLRDAERTHPVVRDPDQRTSRRFVDPCLLLREMPEHVPPVEGEPMVDVVIGALHDVRRLVGRFGCERLSRSKVDDLMLVTSEIASNAIRHGRGEARLALWLMDDGVICEVSDDGPGPDDPLEGYVPPVRKDLGGAGMWIARHLCDSFAVDRRDDRTAVRFALSA